MKDLYSNWPEGWHYDEHDGRVYDDAHFSSFSFPAFVKNFDLKRKEPDEQPEPGKAG
jgi:hypothetical protein